MREFSPNAQQRILSEYRARCRGRGFDALAARFGVPGGGRTVQRWFSRWDGTVASLQALPRAGRPRTLTAAQVARHIAAPIRAANRAHRAIRYTTLYDRLPLAVRQSVSLRTVQRLGQQLGARSRRTIKRTAEEREYARARHAGGAQLRLASSLLLLRVVSVCE